MILLRSIDSNICGHASISPAFVIDFGIEHLRLIDFAIRIRPTPTPTMTSDSTFAPCMDMHGSRVHSIRNIFMAGIWGMAGKWGTC